jgi:hypothetical protein
MTIDINKKEKKKKKSNEQVGLLGSVTWRGRRVKQ